MELNIKNLNTLTEVENTRNKINEELDKRRDYIVVCIEADKASHMPFGYINEAFENISGDLFHTKKGKLILKQYTNLVKSNKNLSSMHSIYESLRKSNKGTDIDFVINSLTSTNWEIDTKTLEEDSNKLGRILAEGMIFLGKESLTKLPEVNKTFSDAVEFIAENKKSNKNIAEYGRAIKIIKEELSSKESNNDIRLKHVDLDEMIEKMVSRFNAKYSNQLSEAEFSAIKEICESENREDVFNKYKQSCIDKLTEAKSSYETEKNDGAVSKMAKIIEQVSNKTYSLDSLTTDISKFIELKEVF